MADFDARDHAGCELIAEALQVEGSVRIRLTGTSMLPAIWPGEVLAVEQPRSTSIGDIVLFMREGRLFAHRVVERGNGQLITRGDAVMDSDPPLSAAQALGRVTAIIRDSGIERPRCPPSIRQRLITLLIRRSDFVYRLTLKSHNLFTKLRNNRGRLTASLNSTRLKDERCRRLTK
jgi:signal peptidase I